MIHERGNYGKTKNIAIAEFGTGDIQMVGSKKGKNGETVLAFKTHEKPHPINVKEKSDWKSFDEMKPEIVFIFNKIESIDSLISMLEDCKSEMNK